MASNKEIIRDFYGRIIGTIEQDYAGKYIARDFYGRIVGTYDPKLNVTRDFYGQIIGQGNLLSATIYNANNETKKK